MKDEPGDISQKLNRLLMQYRLTPHSTTHTNPAELMFGRQFRSRLDIMKYDLQTDMNERSPCELSNNKFAVGDPAKFRVYPEIEFTPQPIDIPACCTEKSKHVEELIHQYFEGLVKDIQTVDSVISYN
jgi:hypothetical protein